MRVTALLPAALAASLLAGCAGGTSTSDNAKDFRGDQKAVAEVVDDFAKAGKDRDAKEICTTIFAKDVAAKLKQGTDDCEDVVKNQLDDASNYDLDVKKIAVDGTTATAQVESQFDGEDALRTLTFVKDGQAWRIASISGG